MSAAQLILKSIFLHQKGRLAPRRGFTHSPHSSTVFLAVRIQTCQSAEGPLLPPRWEGSKSPARIQL